MNDRTLKALLMARVFALQFVAEVDNELTHGDPHGRRTEASCSLYGALEAVEIAEESCTPA